MTEQKCKFTIKKFLKICGITIMGLAIAGLFALAFGLLLKALWNWLMPAIFGLGAITYWQAVGLFILAKLLFTGLHGHHGSHHEHEFPRKFKTWREWHDSHHAGKKHLPEEKIEAYHEYWEKEGENAFNSWLDKQGN